MPQNILDGMIPSRTRVQILVKLFLNPNVRAYLRSLSKEFGVSPNGIRTELNNLSRNKYLVSERGGRNIYYRANTDHPLFPELFSMVRKITGIDELVRSVVDRLGNLEAAYLVGDYARGVDTGIIDVVLVGDVDKIQLNDFSLKTEVYIHRKIRSLVLCKEEFVQFMEKKSFEPIVKLWDQMDTTWRRDKSAVTFKAD
ncbi:MAG: winged helix-turn-helix domain-containing protein [Deltaproteobacteria bacterium]|nr:winged helix-turn-helix domain-containing protein [Candidatus Deferrimicrobium borealis]